MKDRNYHLELDKRMFDFESFYTKMADALPERSVIAEVGLADGASSIFLAETLLNFGKKFRLHLIDSLAYGGPDQLNTLLSNITKARLGHWVEILTFDSLNASCRFPDGHFDFVFIDASHRYELTKADIRLWHRKIKPEGLLAGHDYNDGEGAEVKMAVDEVVPKESLQVVETKKKFNVWWIKSPQYVQLR